MAPAETDDEFTSRVAAPCFADSEETDADWLARHVRTLRSPFRNADDRDWDYLFTMIPDSGHGRFWIAVMVEMRGAQTRNSPLHRPGEADAGAYRRLATAQRLGGGKTQPPMEWQILSSRPNDLHLMSYWRHGHGHDQRPNQGRQGHASHQ